MKRNRIQETSMEVTVGAFMFMVLLALGLFTIVLSRQNIFTRSYRLEVVFDSVMGLREGDNVYMRGVDVGKIKRIEIGTGGVHIVANLNREIRLHEDYRMEILPASVLGGRYLNLYEGSEAKPALSPQTVVRGIPPVDLIEEASKTIKSVKEALDEGGILENLKATMEQVKNVTAKLDKGEGTIGRLLADDTVYNDLKTVSASLREVSERVNRGEGTLGKLLAKDDTVYQDLKAVTANLREVSERLNRGEGTLGKLLAKDDKLYQDLSEAVAAVRKVTVSISEGQGSLGKLVKDDELYNETRLLLREARATIDDFRETTPLTTFTTIFFGAF